MVSLPPTTPAGKTFLIPMDLAEAKRAKETNSSYGRQRHPWELARIEVVIRLLGKSIHNTKGFTVADIGCGDLFFVQQMSLRFPEITFLAIDTAFTDELIAHYESDVQKLNIRIFRTLGEAATAFGKPVDVVLLLDVIEHIENDREFLGNLSGNRLIGADTQVMISVPAYQVLFSSHDVFLGHFRRYTDALLHRTIRDSGFERRRSGYFFFLLILPRLLATLSEYLSGRKENTSTGLVTWRGGRIVTTIIKNLLLLDFHFSQWIHKITGIRIPGLSNYILCQKRAS
jgi:2-polyprenyl-3-methyl-5-hydroxy-6-metoxy-1,4-benzoquinol methylase